jgi:Domain of unknown function (DUF397)
MTATNPAQPPTPWRKSTHSNNGGNCIEITRHGHSDIAVRDSADPAGPQLAFTPSQWHAFTTTLKS